jgi:Holliday junction DNA helicase RuvA
MISRLSGTVVHIDLKHIVVDVNGVGYKISATSDTISGVLIDQNISLWTYLAVREDSMDLYGFTSREELNFFELLITVSGIGPKTALGILNVSSVETLEMAIENEDMSHLTKVSGIGKKVAEKIIMELRDKVQTTVRTPGQAHSMKKDADAIEALKSLGYREQEAREALKSLDKDKNNKKTADTGERIKAALKILGR